MVHKLHRRVHRLSLLLNPPPSEKLASQKHPRMRRSLSLLSESAIGTGLGGAEMQVLAKDYL